MSSSSSFTTQPDSAYESQPFVVLRDQMSLALEETRAKIVENDRVILSMMTAASKVSPTERAVISKTLTHTRQIQDVQFLLMKKLLWQCHAQTVKMSDMRATIGAITMEYRDQEDHVKAVISENSRLRDAYNSNERVKTLEAENARLRDYNSCEDKLRASLDVAHREIGSLVMQKCYASHGVSFPRQPEPEPESEPSADQPPDEYESVVERVGSAVGSKRPAPTDASVARSLVVRQRGA